MSARNIKDITKALQAQFSPAKAPLSLPPESRRLLQHFVNEHAGEASEEDSARANAELKTFWEKYVGESPRKLGLFVGVLRELRPAIAGEDDILEWWHLVVKPVITGIGFKKPALEDAREFLVGVMAFDEEDGDDDNHQQEKTSRRLCGDLLSIYIARSRALADNDQFIAPENAQVTQQVEDVLIAFGRKRPKDLFHSLDGLIVTASTRLQGLTLLSSFLRHQAPHIYLVINTPLVDHLLVCLMNDTSTAVLAVTLTSLIMLFPHIPGSLGPHLPRLFLIYSRLLCWEKFSPLSTEAQKNLVTDDRVSNETEDGRDPGDVGIDPNWERARPLDATIEAATPELMSYFTSLYGLYPINFMSYIRKPRRYLKNVDFPGADDFDLDQAVIRGRTDQFRQVHLLHPNFCNLTIEEELIDPKWPKMDPADVVGECQGYCMNSKPWLVSPGPPPSKQLPDVPPIPPLNTAGVKASGQISPSPSHASFRSKSSWRDTQSTTVAASGTEGDSPVLGPVSIQTGGGPADHLRPRSKASATTMRTSSASDDFHNAAHPSPKERAENSSETNLIYLQQQITLLQNELNFERWHKAQYSQHIGQIMRRNVKEATVEAETLNLINANRALKKQLDQLREAREATVKDSVLTRKQANNLEANMADRLNKLKAEQEMWQEDAAELQRLRSETKQYRELLVATEARELNKSQQIELMKRDLEQLQDVQSELKQAQKKLHAYEYREFEFETANRQRDIFRNEKENLLTRIQQHERDRERMRQIYAGKVAELESQLAVSGDSRRTSSIMSTADIQLVTLQAVAESEAKLTQLKKAHSRLLEKFTDLELEYQTVRSQFELLQGGKGKGTFFEAGDDGERSFSFGSRVRPSSDYGYNIIGEYNAPLAPPMSQATMHHKAGLTFEGSRGSATSGSTGTAAAFNQSPPLGRDEMVSVFEGSSGGSGTVKKEKIQPDSTVRVYGRGGAQNIKLKQKDSQKGESNGGKKSSPLKGLRNLV